MSSRDMRERSMRWSRASWHRCTMHRRRAGRSTPSRRRQVRRAPCWLTLCATHRSTTDAVPRATAHAGGESIACRARCQGCLRRSGGRLRIRSCVQSRFQEVRWPISGRMAPTTRRVRDGEQFRTSPTCSAIGPSQSIANCPISSANEGNVLQNSR
jgi:hypothetical protein